MSDSLLDLSALEQWHAAAQPIADPYSLTETRFMESYAESFAAAADDAEMANYAEFHAMKVALRAQNDNAGAGNDNMDTMMAAADLVLCRAGAITVSELQAQGKPAILIPSPNVAENHQYHNAMALVDENAACILEEKNYTKEAMDALFCDLVGNDEKRRAMEQNALRLAKPDAKREIADIILSLVP